MTSQTPEVTEIEEVVNEMFKYELIPAQVELENPFYWDGYKATCKILKPKIKQALLSQQQKHREELQKARQDWLQEEIVRLEGMKMANEHNSECLHNEAPEYCDCDNYIKWNKALQTIIDRYQAELNQDNK